MVAKVEIGARMDSLHLFESERKFVFDVGRGIGIVGQLVVVVETGSARRRNRARGANSMRVAFHFLTTRVPRRDARKTALILLETRAYEK